MARRKRKPCAMNKRKKKLRVRDGDLCCYCETPMLFYVVAKGPLASQMATVEHVKRRADGGTNDLENLKLACMDCNTRRGTLSYEYWRFLRKPGSASNG